MDPHGGTSMKRPFTVCSSSSLLHWSHPSLLTGFGLSATVTTLHNPIYALYLNTLLVMVPGKKPNKDQSKDDGYAMEKTGIGGLPPISDGTGDMRMCIRNLLEWSELQDALREQGQNGAPAGSRAQVAL